MGRMNTLFSLLKYVKEAINDVSQPLNLPVLLRDAQNCGFLPVNPVSRSLSFDI
jgi:hypothetical protein